MTSIPAMTPETCLAIAGMMPIFLVGLIAEKLVFKPKGKSRGDRALQLIQVFLRAVIDLCTAVLIVAAIGVALVGTVEGGLSGRDSETEWTLTIFAVLIVVARWVALSPGFRYPLDALFDLVLTALFVGVGRTVLARTTKRMRSRRESIIPSAQLDVEKIEDRAAIVTLLTLSLLDQVRELVSTKRLPRSKQATLSPLERPLLASESEFTTRLMDFWSTIPGAIQRVRDPAQRSLVAMRDLSSFAKVIRTWAIEPASLTREVIEKSTGRRLFKSFLRMERNRVPQSE